MTESITKLTLGVSTLALIEGCTLPDLKNRRASTALPTAEARRAALAVMKVLPLEWLL